MSGLNWPTGIFRDGFRISSIIPTKIFDVEIKEWLDLSTEDDKANLAQALIAIANHGGGYILLGFLEADASWEPSPNRPESSKKFTQDAINGIVQRYAEPAFHCHLDLVKRKADGSVHPVITVPGGHAVPIRSKRHGPNMKHLADNTYYIRRPGPCSEPPRSSEEWDRLIRKCVLSKREELLDEIRTVLVGVQTLPSPTRDADIVSEWEAEAHDRWLTLTKERFGDYESSPYRFGYWTASYVLGDAAEISLPNFLSILARLKGYTGWRPWWVPTRTGIRPYPAEGGIECWLVDGAEDASHADFWRAETPPRLFLLRGYQEDSVIEGVNSGAVFDLTLPVWRVGEVLMHSSELAEALGISDSTATVQFAWRGLAGRRLAAVASRTRHISGEYRARQDHLSSRVSATAQSIPELLPELVRTATEPLYALFDFFQPPDEMYAEELNQMKSRTVA